MSASRSTPAPASSAAAAAPRRSISPPCARRSTPTPKPRGRRARATALLKDAGCDVDGWRVRFPRGLARQLVSTAPREFIQHARSPARSVPVGGKATVFAPVYGSPFVHDLDRGRRYGTIEDFCNFVKLAYQSPYIHHSGGTVCEPVDLPVNKRHLEMVYAHMRWSDKAYMGSVTPPERAT